MRLGPGRVRARDAADLVDRGAAAAQAAKLQVQTAQSGKENGRFWAGMQACGGVLGARCVRARAREGGGHGGMGFWMD